MNVGKNMAEIRNQVCRSTGRSPARNLMTRTCSTGVSRWMCCGDAMVFAAVSDDFSIADAAATTRVSALTKPGRCRVRCCFNRRSASWDFVAIADANFCAYASTCAPGRMDTSSLCCAVACRLAVERYNKSCARTSPNRSLNRIASGVVGYKWVARRCSHRSHLRCTP